MSDDNDTCPSCRQSVPSLVPPQWILDAYAARRRESQAAIAAAAKDTPDE